MASGYKVLRQPEKILEYEEHPLWENMPNFSKRDHADGGDFAAM